MAVTRHQWPARLKHFFHSLLQQMPSSAGAGGNEALGGTPPQLSFFSPLDSSSSACSLWTLCLSGPQGAPSEKWVQPDLLLCCTTVQVQEVGWLVSAPRWSCNGFDSSNLPAIDLTHYLCFSCPICKMAITMPPPMGEGLGMMPGVE